MYKFYKDKPENFECNVTIEGASLSKSRARLVLENSEYNIIFEGNIDDNGKCIIPVKKLSILPEGLTGKLKLEVIVEDDTYFSPYQSDFTVAVNKKVTVEAIEQPKTQITNKKVTVDVTPPQITEKVVSKPINNKKFIKEIVHSDEFKEKIKSEIINKGFSDREFYENSNKFIKKLMISELKSILSNKKR